MKDIFDSNKTRDIYYKTAEEIELLRSACLLVCKVLAHVGSRLRPGITGLELDKEAEEIVRDHGAIPAFKGYPGANGPFPATLCVSKNEVIVHGVPDKEEFRDGDIVSVDCGTLLEGFHGDAAYTFAIGNVDEEVMKLLRVTKQSLYRGIKQATHGKRIGDLSYAIQNFTEREHSYSVVRELVGHGVGKALHEDPEVPNYGRRGNGLMMKDGLVIAIEPMINLGKREVAQGNDGWTIFAKDRLPSAHYEHTIAVRKGGEADILSDHKPVEAAIAQNSELKVVGEYEESATA